MTVLPGPDFPTNHGYSRHQGCLRDSRGSNTVRAKKVHVEQVKSGRRALLLPVAPRGSSPGKVAQAVNESISDMRDESTVRACVFLDLKRDAIPQVMQTNLAKTQLRALAPGLVDWRPSLVRSEILRHYIDRVRRRTG